MTTAVWLDKQFVFHWKYDSQGSAIKIESDGFVDGPRLRNIGAKCDGDRINKSIKKVALC